MIAEQKFASPLDIHDWPQRITVPYPPESEASGIADRPYRPNDVMDEILWTLPQAKALVSSPAVQMVRWAQARFPALYPGGVVDTAPLMRPRDDTQGRRAKIAQLVSALSDISTAVGENDKRVTRRVLAAAGLRVPTMALRQALSWQGRRHRAESRLRRLHRLESQPAHEAPQQRHEHQHRQVLLQELAQHRSEAALTTVMMY